MYKAGDRWWFATLLLYGPRWLALLPLAGFVLAAAWYRRWTLSLTIALQMLLGFQFLGLNVPWPAFGSEAQAGYAVRVLTCNVHFDELDVGAMHELVRQIKPDIVALQGFSPSNHASLFAKETWQIKLAGHLCLASRYPIVVEEELRDSDFEIEDSGAARYFIATPRGVVCVANLHLASPRDGLEEIIQSHGASSGRLVANIALRRRQSEKASRWLKAIPGPVLIAGDFNTVLESRIYQDLWSGYCNAFTSAGTGIGNTHFTRKTAVRIDHLLAGPGWYCVRCWVEAFVGSSHRPLVADWQRCGG